MPALLNRRSSRPNSSFTFANSAFTAAGSPTSVGTASEREPVALPRLRRGVELLLTPADQHHGIALGHQRQRRRPADPAAGTRDERHLALPAHGLFPPGSHPLGGRSGTRRSECERRGDRARGPAWPAGHMDGSFVSCAAGHGGRPRVRPVCLSRNGDGSLRTIFMFQLLNCKMREAWVTTGPTSRTGDRTGAKAERRGMTARADRPHARGGRTRPAVRTKKGDQDEARTERATRPGAGVAYP